MHMPRDELATTICIRLFIITHHSKLFTDILLTTFTKTTVRMYTHRLPCCVIIISKLTIKSLSSLVNESKDPFNLF